ncbi:MAG: riboflavin synthase [Fimbriimonadaceae bacterium]|nr:riboflavin synthase [Fimbriimonadaceae bacterium]
MFTGIVQAVGQVLSLEKGVLRLTAPGEWVEDDPLGLGESIAVNGCCLTVVDIRVQDAEGSGSAGKMAAPRRMGLQFDLSPETLSRTALGDLERGSRVNLERAMKPSDRFGGHIVQGHVDATGIIRSVSHELNTLIAKIGVPGEAASYLIDKGSIAVDGVSLTVVRPQGDEFEVWIIPHTVQQTQIGGWEAGDRVNLEYDVVAKYVERLVTLGRA